MGTQWFLLINRRALLDKTYCSSGRTRRRDFIELTGIYGLVLLIIWTPQPYQWALWAIGGITAATVITMSWEGLRPLGICKDNLVRSLWAVALSLVLAVGAIALASRLHTLHFPGSLRVTFGHFGLYVLWAAVQQLMLQCFFLVRSIRLLSNTTAAACVTALMFAVAHLPNPVLTVITLFFGFAASFFFLHYKNLVPLAVAHAILGIAIAVSVPNSLDHNMRVGIGYLTYVNHNIISQATQAPIALKR